MNIEEIKTVQEMHYKRAEKICQKYYMHEDIYETTMIEDFIDAIITKDKKLINLHSLINELQKIENRIKELEELCKKK